MNRRDRKSAVAKAKAEGMNRRDRKALGRKLKAESYLDDDDDGRIGLRKAEDLIRSRANAVARDQINQLRKFNESEYASRKYKLDDEYGLTASILLGNPRRRR